MNYYQNIIECLNYVNLLETNKLFLVAFHEELLTGQQPSLIELNPNFALRYLMFKRQYLLEIETSKALLEQQYYLNTLTKEQLLVA